MTLIITTRGIALPPGIRWSNVKTAALDPLSLPAAKPTFTDIAGEPDSDAENDALTQLLRAVDSDCMPIAVWLLAQLTQRGKLPSRLLQRWKDSSTRDLRTEPRGRKYNVEASVELSVSFLPAPEVDPGPCELLTVCSLLLDGLFPDVRKQLDDCFANIDGAADVLEQHALVYVGPAGELKMLSPIRQSIIRCHPISDIHATALRRIYLAIAMDAPNAPDEHFQQRAAKLAPEYGNVMAYLLSLPTVATRLRRSL